MSTHPHRGDLADFAQPSVNGGVFDLAGSRTPARDNLLREIKKVPFAGVRCGDASGAAMVWRLSVFAGRIGEISGRRSAATLTLAFRLVLEAQRLGEPVAWITRSESAFYPPDAAEAAVDLKALVVIRVPGLRQAALAADRLVRSGAFGLVVLDLGANAHLSPAAESRLAGLTRRHHAAVVCLTEKERERPSLGSLVSIRVEAIRSRAEQNLFLCEARTLKDKRCGPGWIHREACHGPDGLY